MDGEPAPVLRADYLLQGVPVPAGRHEIRLEYHEPAIGRGIAGSVVVWLAFLALGGGLAARGAQEPEPSARRLSSASISSSRSPSSTRSTSPISTFVRWSFTSR